MTRNETLLSGLVGPGKPLPTIGMIAAGTGYSRSYICYLLLGSRNGSIAALSAIAGYLGCSLDALLNALKGLPQPRAKGKR